MCNHNLHCTTCSTLKFFIVQVERANVEGITWIWFVIYCLCIDLPGFITSSRHNFLIYNVRADKETYIIQMTGLTACLYIKSWLLNVHMVLQYIVNYHWKESKVIGLKSRVKFKTVGIGHRAWWRRSGRHSLYTNAKQPLTQTINVKLMTKGGMCSEI